MFEDIFEEMRRLQREINRSFGEFWESDQFRALPDHSRNKRISSLMRSPLTDLEETDKEMIAKFELPGVDKKDIQLNITPDRIEVKVEKKQEAKIEKKGFYREERSYRGFYRSMALPSEVIPEKAKAKYRDGILEVLMPKVENKKKSRIEIE
ncbi:MAG: Hsp20/alpha crystallin family protein [Candidatus Pacearchaeota archaeon]